jgi:hypothetical protein
MSFDRAAYVLELDTIECHLSSDPSIDWEATAQKCGVTDALDYVTRGLNPELSLQFAAKSGESLSRFELRIPPPDVVARASKEGIEGGMMAYFLGERCIERVTGLMAAEEEFTPTWKACPRDARIPGHERWNKVIDAKLKSLLRETGIKELGWIVYLQAQGEGKGF